MYLSTFSTLDLSWTQMGVATDESFGRQATTTGDDEDDDADDEDDEEDADVYRAFQQVREI